MRGKLYKTMAHRLRAFPKEVVEDCLSEACLHFLQTYDPNRKTKMTTWAYICVHGIGLEYVRAHQPLTRKGYPRAQIFNYSDLVAHELDDKFDRPDTRDDYNVVEQRLILEPLLSRLSTRSRIVVERHAQGDTLREIANDLNIGESRCNQIRVEAHKKMREYANAIAV